MRILHTADWHLGRPLEGRSRLDEQAEWIDELVEIVKEERIDLLLMAGDVFDTFNPPAEAEELFYDALARLSMDGRCSLVFIAGNHDQPDRLAAVSPLLKGRNLHLLGRPWKEVLHLITVGGEKAVLYALPYPSEARLRESFGAETEEGIQRAFDERIAALFREASFHFRPDAVNLAMSHLFVAGGMESESEREIQVGGAYTVSATSLPEGAHYVALGHLHRPQNVKGSPSLARYAGSPLAYSFSEAGYAKSVTLIEAVAGKREVETKDIFIRSGKPLVIWKAVEGLSQVYQWLDEGRDRNAWLQIDLYVDEPLFQEEILQIRKSHPGIIHIRAIYPEMEKNETFFADRSLPLHELFRRFYRRTNGRDPEEELVVRFLSLVEGEEDNLNAPDPIKD